MKHEPDVGKRSAARAIRAALACGVTHNGLAEMSRANTVTKGLLIVAAGGWVTILLLVVQAHRTSWWDVRSMEPRPAMPPPQDWRIGDVDEEGNLVHDHGRI